MTTARLRPAISAAALAASAIVIAGSSPAHAQDDATKQACVAAYDETQSLRQKGTLRAAREKALACSQEACPAIVKKDCAQWLGELEASLPTVSFAVKDATGQDTTDARVFLDGQPLEPLSASAVQLDPGERTFRVEIEGKPPIERKVVIREGQKGRVLEFSFAEATDSGRTQPPGGDADQGSAGIPVASWVLGGVGVVGLGLFATFGALGLSEKSDAEDPAGGCAPNCTDDEVSSIRGKFLVADISLGVGIAAIGAAVIVAFASGGPGGGDGEAAAKTAAPSFSVGAAPLPGGGFASATGSF